MSFEVSETISLDFSPPVSPDLELIIDDNTKLDTDTELAIKMALREQNTNNTLNFRTKFKYF